MSGVRDVCGEFELFSRYFAPLAKGCPGAFGLLDDAAVMRPAAGHDLVVKTDAIVGGIHFQPHDPPDLRSTPNPSAWISAALSLLSFVFLRGPRANSFAA